MSTHNKLSDAELFERYLGQAAKLPIALRKQVEVAFGGEPVLAYALADLDAELRFRDSWLVLGRDQAAVVGDTVGDPLKDTAGPSLHVLIKLLSTITLVFAPLFI